VWYVYDFAFCNAASHLAMTILILRRFKKIKRHFTSTIPLCLEIKDTSQIKSSGGQYSGETCSFLNLFSGGYAEKCVRLTMWVKLCNRHRIVQIEQHACQG
jgi:hypothetical protein